MSRSVRLWLATALVLILAGCAGQVDLTKTVTPRTTVKASGAFNDEALRMVEPCGLFTDELVSSIGKKKATSAPNRQGYSECAMPITDTETGKQTINLTVKIGVDLLAAPKTTGKTIRGLGVYETRGSASCTQSAIIERDPEQGIVAQVYWDGGDMCAAASKLIESVIKQLAGKPPVYQDTPGSLVKLEPCAALDDTTVRNILAEAGQKTPYGIRTCLYRGKAPYIEVEYSIGADPMSGNSSNNPVKIDLTDKVKGAAQYRERIAPNKCVVEWVHRALSGNRNENVRVAFERSPAQPGEDPCAKAVDAAKAVAGTVAKS
ncbi:MAG: hypothetical protein ABW224_08945 [Kibdelosporangium sp.]